MTRPGTGKVLPNMLAEIPHIDPDTAAAALAMLGHWGAMDVAPMLGLVEEPPTRPPARGITRRCRCGDCRSCNQAKPWACPDCAATVQWGSRKRHRTSVHGWVPDSPEATP